MSFRVLHTSDWHLGRMFREKSLHEDQEWVLDRLVEAARSSRPDVIVVAGDVYDRAVPSAQAVELLDETLNRLAGLGIPVVVIAGNHDSPERLSFGSRLLERVGVHLRGALDRVATPVEIPGKGFVYALPFVDPELVRARVADESIRGHAAATERVVSEARTHAATRSLPAVLVGHAFVQGGTTSGESERSIAVGGAGTVPAECLAGFDYVALGHLHEPQEVTAGIRYSGSLLKYSFDEAHQSKAALLVEVDRGAARVEPIPLGQKRDVARIRGLFEDLLAKPEFERFRGDLLEVTLEDDGYVLDARNRLEARFPYVAEVKRARLETVGDGQFVARVRGAAGDDHALFKAFVETVSGAAPTAEQAGCFAATVEELDRKERRA